MGKFRSVWGLWDCLRSNICRFRTVRCSPKHSEALPDWAESVTNPSECSGIILEGLPDVQDCQKIANFLGSGIIPLLKYIHGVSHCK